MNVARVAVLSLAAFGTSLCHAATEGDKTPAATQPAETTAYSSSVAATSSTMPVLVDAPSTVAFGEKKKYREMSFKPFSSVAVAVKVGVGGIGFDLATPLGRHFNLRGGGMFFGYNTSIVTDDGYQVNGDLKLKTVTAMLDYAPFGGSFRISPGIVFYNGNGLQATATVPASGTFDLGDQTYKSSVEDPLHGSLGLTFGNKVAPALTVGWGNMIPRHLGQHWSVPFEIGFEYISDPKITLQFAGTACTDTTTTCHTTSPTAQNLTTNPEAQANTLQEQNDLNSDISALKVYPIVSIGLSYKF